MGHNIKPGVATGKEVQEIFNHAKANGYALPAVNVIGSNTINGVLETAKSFCHCWSNSWSKTCAYYGRGLRCSCNFTYRPLC